MMLSFNPRSARMRITSLRMGEAWSALIDANRYFPRGRGRLVERREVRPPLNVEVVLESR